MQRYDFYLLPLPFNLFKCIDAMKMKSLYLFLLISLWGAVSTAAWAQSPDFTTWTALGFEYQLKPALSLSGGLEYRSKNDLHTTDRWGLDVGIGYKLASWLKVGAIYEVHYRDRGSDGWKFRHRYGAQATLSTRVQCWKLSLRERVQNTTDGKKDEIRLRSRVKVAYDLPKCKLEPYISVEMYNGLNRGDDFDVTRMRYRGGFTFPLFSRWTAELFYLRQWESDERRNVVGVECVYSF